MSHQFLPVIKSPQNPHYKLWRRYVNHPESDDVPWLAVEGARQIEELASRCVPELLVCTAETEEVARQIAPTVKQSFTISKPLMRRLSPVQTPQGLIGFFEKPSWQWHELGTHLLFVDQLRDPGNLGTLFRTAAATGMFAIVTAPGTVGVFNSKVIRATSGYLFCVPFRENESLQSIQGRGYQIWAADPSAAPTLYEASFQAPLAIVVGNESHGLPKCRWDFPYTKVRIPMAEGVDSLNAGVSASLLMYEIFRRSIGHD